MKWLALPQPDPDASLKDIVDLAQEAFWAVVASMHPDVKTGDWTPDQQDKFDKACMDAVHSWLDNNLPR